MRRNRALFDETLDLTRQCVEQRNPTQCTKCNYRGGRFTICPLCGFDLLVGDLACDTSGSVPDTKAAP